MAVRDIRSLDLAMLRTFDALMRERSVSRAAERLFLSQPAVSASLSRLREAFDDPLFTRTAHGVVPTPRACAMATRVEHILAEVHGLLEAERPFDPAQSDRVFHVAGSDYAGQLLLPPLGRRLLAASATVRLMFEPAGFPTMVERLRKGDIDIGILPSARPAGDLQTELLYEDDYVFAARHGHPRFADGVTLDDFCTVPQVFFGHGQSGFAGVTDEVLRGLGRERFVQIAAHSFAQLVDLLVHADYAAVLPRRIASAHTGSLAHWPLPFALPGYQSFLCWHRRHEDDGGVRWLRGELLAAAGGDGPGGHSVGTAVRA